MERGSSREPRELRGFGASVVCSRTIALSVLLLHRETQCKPSSKQTHIGKRPNTLTTESRAQTERFHILAANSYGISSHLLHTVLGAHLLLLSRRPALRTSSTPPFFQQLDVTGVHWLQQRPVHHIVKCAQIQHKLLP